MQTRSPGFSPGMALPPRTEVRATAYVALFTSTIGITGDADGGLKRNAARPTLRKEARVNAVMGTSAARERAT